MVEIRKHKTPEGKIPFDKWLKSMKDKRAASQVMVRIRRLSMSLEGDHKSVGENVVELRIHTGKGYRIYFYIAGAELIVLLCGGDKSTQQKDIKKAKQLAKDL